jgi:hypothetical protein
MPPFLKTLALTPNALTLADRSAYRVVAASREVTSSLLQTELRLRLAGAG